MQAIAMVPGGASDEGVLHFKYGGLGRAVVSELAEFIVDRFAGSLLIVELPMRRLSDPQGSIDRFETIVKGDEIFAICAIGETVATVEDALMAHDPTFLYNAFVLQGAAARSWVRSDADHCFPDSDEFPAVIVGAYDGEGFVLLLRDHFDSVSRTTTERFQ
ncbi:hypothetical protein [Nocardia altamirensis]|uniref:hypothetical protein n=1 Tax=Nocardia altamirensis TaxID=472158 RepID=UPI00083FE123|nr:hypothetical protein [Nocardia altamirensis]